MPSIQHSRQMLRFFYKDCILSVASHIVDAAAVAPRNTAQRRAAPVLLLSLTPLLKSPQNPNDLGALLHSFSLLGVLSSSNFFLLLAQYEC